MNGKQIEYDIPFNPKYNLYDKSGCIETSQQGVFTFDHVDLLKIKDFNMGRFIIDKLTSFINNIT